MLFGSLLVKTGLYGETVPLQEWLTFARILFHRSSLRSFCRSKIECFVLDFHTQDLFRCPRVLAGSGFTTSPRFDSVPTGQ